MSTIVASHRLTVLGTKAVYPCGETGHATNIGVMIFCKGACEPFRVDLRNEKVT